MYADNYKRSYRLSPPLSRSKLHHLYSIPVRICEIPYVLLKVGFVGFEGSGFTTTLMYLSIGSIGPQNAVAASQRHLHIPDDIMRPLIVTRIGF